MEEIYIKLLQMLEESESQLKEVNRCTWDPTLEIYDGLMEMKFMIDKLRKES